MTKMRQSANFFKKPTLGEIKKQYNNSKTLKSESNARLNAAIANKKIMGLEETDNDDMKKRQVIEQKLLDFSARNRFKGEVNLPKKISQGILGSKGLPMNQGATAGTTKEEETEYRDLRSDRREDDEPNDAKPACAEETAAVKEKKTDQSEEINLDCVICFNQKADMVCMPCGHSGICKACSLKICSKDAACFLCKKPVEQLLQIDLTRTIGEMVIVLSSITISPKGSETN